MVRMTTATNPLTRAGRHTLDADDHALVRVPQAQRRSWWLIANLRLGQATSLAHLALAATVGAGMRFWEAMAATGIAAVFLTALSILLGLAAQREGLTTSLLGRWSGFGVRGSLLIGLILIIGMTGWFAVQTRYFAAGLTQFLPEVEMTTICLVAGLATTVVLARGFVVLTRIAAVVVPISLLLAAVTVIAQLGRHDVGALLDAPPPGAPISLAAGTSIILGGFLLGAVTTPDVARYHRSCRDVVAATLLSVTLGPLLVGVAGVLLAHALRVAGPGDVPALLGVVQSGSGLVGVTLLVASVLKANGPTGYVASLAVVNLAHVARGVRLRQPMMTVLLGAFGTALALPDWLDRYDAALAEVGALLAPIAAVMIADYFILRTWRTELDESRGRGDLPGYAPAWGVGGLLAWLIGYAVASPLLLGRVLDLGVPAVTAFVVAVVVYLALARAGLAGKGRDDLERCSE